MSSIWGVPNRDVLSLGGPDQRHPKFRVSRIEASSVQGVPNRGILSLSGPD